MKYVKLLTVLFVCLLIVACSNKDNTEPFSGPSDEELENLNESEFPIVKDKITLDFFAGQAPLTADDWNDVLLFNEYEKMSNIHIEWQMVPRESLAEKRNLILGDVDNLPDAFHTTAMPASDILKYGKQGILLPLNDLIDEYAPNVKKILDENPDIRKAITFPDGNIYSLPMLKDPDFLSHIVGDKTFINEEWLEALTLDMPETTDEFYEYLKAVKEENPSNGRIDEIPFGVGDVGQLISYLTGSFGIANQGMANPNIDIDPDTKDLRFYPVSDNYKQLLEYVHELYKEELIDPSILDIESDRYHANFSEGRYGSTIDWGPEFIFGEEVGSVYTSMPPLEGPNGDKTYTSIYPAVADIGAFLITSKNENPVATIRWIDYFYSDEGMKLFFLGVEGETYEETKDGSYEFMDHITNSAEGLSTEQEAAKYLTFPGGLYPSVSKEEYFTGSEGSAQSIEAVEPLKPYLVEEPWEPFQYTEEEYKKLSSFGADIEKYIEEMRDKFINGDASFSDWDSYVETIEDMGLDEYMQIKENAYERYQES